MFSSPVSIGESITYGCDPMFELIGMATAMCMGIDQDTAEFSSGIPTCRGNESFNHVSKVSLLGEKYL